MFSPKEIRDTEFERIVRGYNPEDVDGFLSQIADQIEKLISDKDTAEKKMREMAEKMDNYREDGDALRSVLVTAEKMKDQMLSEAHAKSEQMVAAATAQAEQLVNTAQSQSDEIVGEISTKVAREEATLKTLKKQVSDFKNNVLNTYKKHLESLSELPEDDSDYETTDQDSVTDEATSAMADLASIETVAQTQDSDFAFPEFDDVKPADKTERVVLREVERSGSAKTAVPFSAESDDKGNRFGKLDFGESFTFGAE
ncbi:MAG: DivIVA domain-containing protein [Oscillospiraceae bacterium]